jgi:hypothetical protein
MLSSTILVGDPFPRLTHVIEIEHRGHRIHAQTIDMILAQPEQRIGDQEVAYLTTPVIKDQGTPFFMFTFTSIGIFIEMSAIKVTQRMSIFRKVSWNPIQKDTNPLLMHIINEILEIFRWTKATGWSIVARDLISPRAIKRILGNRHQFDMCKPQVFDIG